MPYPSIRCPEPFTRRLIFEDGDADYPTITLNVTSDAKNGGHILVTGAASNSDPQVVADAAWVAKGVESRVNAEFEYNKSYHYQNSYNVSVARSGDPEYIRKLVRKRATMFARSLSKSNDYVQMDVHPVREGQGETMFPPLSVTAEDASSGSLPPIPLVVTRTGMDISVAAENQSDDVAVWVAEGVERRLKDIWEGEKTGDAGDRLAFGSHDLGIRDKAELLGTEFARSLSMQYAHANVEAGRVIRQKAR